MLQRYEEWTDPTWCHTRDWRSIRDAIRRRTTEWESRLHPLLAKKVDISPIIGMLNRSDERLYTMIWKNGWLMDSVPELQYYDTPRPPVEYNSSADEGDEDEEADQTDARDSVDTADEENAADEVDSANEPADDDDDLATRNHEAFTGIEWPTSDGRAENETIICDESSWNEYGGQWNEAVDHNQTSQAEFGEIDAKGNGCWVSSSYVDGAGDRKVTW